MTRTKLLLLAALSAAPLAQAADPVIEPEVARQSLRLPRLPNKDFEAALFAGTYATQNFGSAAVLGVRLGYHLSEDFFVQGSYGRSRVSDEAFRQVLPGGVFPHGKETLQYAHLALGWNLLPGEAFVGRGIAKAGALYLLGGVGSTHVVQQRRQTLVIGAGGRLLVRERLALQLDLRDHLFSLDLLGRRERTQNLEATLGLAWHF